MIPDPKLEMKGLRRPRKNYLYRCVLCGNEVEGIDTPWAKSVIAGNAEYDALKAQRDELLGELREIEHYIKNSPQLMHGRLHKKVHAILERAACSHAPCVCGKVSCGTVEARAK
jgi:hypothetical protein